MLLVVVVLFRKHSPAPFAAWFDLEYFWTSVLMRLRQGELSSSCLMMSYPKLLSSTVSATFGEDGNRSFDLCVLP